MMGDEAKNFEEDVRAVARLLWSEDSFSGAKLIDERERDGVFETRDTINIIESTISARRDKAIDDAKKTAGLVQKLRRSQAKHVNGWLVTKLEPTADQRSATEKLSHSVRLLSFEQFRSMLFNGREYLRYREVYRFGSAADPVTKSVTEVPPYLPIDLYDMEKNETVLQDNFIQSIESRQVRRMMLLGKYGSGKSMTMRYLFLEMLKLYRKGVIHITPIYLNLRDHTGQHNTVEALERHARLVAYPFSSGDLVRAWRAGHVILFLDGFDEMATTGWGGSLDKVRHHRYVGMTLIRKFIAESPPSISIFIAGRDNFFDNSMEMDKSLGLSGNFEILHTDDFSDQQTVQFLNSLGISVDLPDWMPRRPLLLAYLASKGFLEDQSEISSKKFTPGQGWDHLLRMICEREAQQDERLDPETVRHLIERLATLARATDDGRGRIDIITIQNVFRDIAGFPPDEAAQQFILRLPALGPTSLEDSTREFVDEDIAGAARSGDVLRYIEHPFGDAGKLFEPVVCPLGELGSSIVSEHIVESGKNMAVFTNALEIAGSSEETPQLAMGLTEILFRSPEIPVGKEIKIVGAICERLIVDDFSRNFSSVSFRDCLFAECEISQTFPKVALPAFQRCLFGVLDGFFGKHDLPQNFIDCEISEFTLGSETAAKILKADIPEGLKLLLIILRKLFLQKGAARQESAFYRGAIDPRAKRLVPEVLQLLAQEGIAEEVRVRGRVLWHPNRSESARVRKILASPISSSDHIVRRAKDL